MAQKIPMGIGNLGFSNLVFKKKFRFTFEIFNICGGRTIPRHYVKSVARPKFTVEQNDIYFLNAHHYLPSRASWDEITVTYIDVATADAAPLYTWIASIYDFTDPIGLHMGSQRRDYEGTGVLKLWDGCGQLLEIWELYHLFPKSVDFGEVRYDAAELAKITISLRYSDVRYIPVCPTFPITSCCSPCGSTTAQSGTGF